MICPACREEIPDNSQYCQHCEEVISGTNDAPDEAKRFGLFPGLAGLIGGIVVTVIGFLWFSSTQYVFQNQAAIAMGLVLTGLGIMVLAPAWYWVVRPLGSSFAVINPISALQNTTEGYSRKQKAVGYIFGGILLLEGSNVLIIHTAKAVVNRTIPPLFMTFPIVFTLIALAIIGVGARHGMAALMASIWRYDRD